MRLLLGFSLFLSISYGQGQPLFGFLPNTGQFPPAVQFVRYSTPANEFFYLTRDSFVLRGDLRVQLAGISASVQPVGVAPTSAVYNFYLGNNASQWVTGAHMFAGVELTNAYPGISTEFTTTNLSVGVEEGVMALTIAPGADASPIRLVVQNTGTAPFLGPGGVWYAGGNIPGTFIVTAQASQPTGGTSSAITCSLVIDADGTLSLQMPNRNPALETDVTVMFPDYTLTRASTQPALEASYLQYPTNFNEDGAIDNSPCGATCEKAVVASVTSSGAPVWVTVLGGSANDQALLVNADQSGVAVSGSASSSDFPVSGSAPHVTPGSAQDAWLVYLDGATGQLRQATYAGLAGPANVSEQIVDVGGDVAVGGGDASGGFILRWQPAANRFVYLMTIVAQPVSLVFDAASNLYYAARGTGAIVEGVIDPTGKAIGSTASIGLAAGASLTSILLQPAADGTVWLAYSNYLQTAPQAGSSTWVARVAAASGQVLVNARLTWTGTPQNVGLTPLGNLKVLVAGPTPDEATTPDAALVAECPSTSYFAVVSAQTQLVYATYVPAAGFNFAAQNESTGAPPAVASCLATTAGHYPSQAVAPGELVTITGGGFGPGSPAMTVPGGDGRYPVVAGGFNVQIGGLDVPILALARGEIAVQVPYEEPPFTGQPVTVAVFQNGVELGSFPMDVEDNNLELFDTGDRNNSLQLPALAALNQDGTVNSAANPAAVGSVVSVFGSGVGMLSPALQTGGLNPIPPAGTLSTSSLYRACLGCGQVLYLGSAPGLSTGVQQINVQLPGSVPGSGVRPLGFAVGVSDTVEGLFVPGPTGVVFVQ